MTDDRTPLVFEEATSPLYRSNDGRVTIENVPDLNFRRPVMYLIAVDGAPVWRTANRVLADAFIAGYDARGDNERGFAVDKTGERRNA